MKINTAMGRAAGVNQKGVRQHNERLILSLILRHGSLPGSQIARLTGLSAQTVSVILRLLEEDGLLARGAPQRGRVGKPSIPMELAPGGALSIGLKIGRRSTELILADLTGAISWQSQITYKFPVPQHVLLFLRDGLSTIRASHSAQELARMSGIGIAMPFEIWDRTELIGATDQDMAGWRDFDIVAEAKTFCEMPVVVENDAAAACRTELLYGKGRALSDFAYFYVGSFVGGGIVLNHSVFSGLQKNAAAFGSLPVCMADGRVAQLMDTASLHLLESATKAAGMDPQIIWEQPQDWARIEPLLDDWIEKAAEHLAKATMAICAVIDFGTVLVDGAFPDGVRARLVAATQRALDAHEKRGLLIPNIDAGSSGTNARALGAACGPLFSQYLLDANIGLHG